MRTLAFTIGVGALACGNQPCGSSFSQSNLFSSNKPWQGSIPSSWQNSPPSVWTPSTQSTQTPAPTVASRPNPSLAGRSPSEQLQLTKCRSAQSCEKCRQLNCYWDNTARITNRCVALGLESAQVPVEAGQASNLGYCPTSGQQGFLGVNWLAIENSGAAVPNLDGMSDADVRKWLSSIPNYNPDATDSNYPAGVAFKDLLPTAAKAYSDGKIPSTTPWVSFFDTYLSGYSYDANSDAPDYGAYNNFNGYSYDSGYSYDVPNSNGIGSFNSNVLSGSLSNLGSIGSLGSVSDLGSLGSSYSFGGSFPAVSAFSGSVPLPSISAPLGGSFGVASSTSFGLPSSSFGFSSIPQSASSLPMFPSIPAGTPLPGFPSGSSLPLSTPIAAPLPMSSIPMATSFPQPVGMLG